MFSDVVAKVIQLSIISNLLEIMGIYCGQSAICIECRGMLRSRLVRVIKLNSLSATYNLQQTTISNFAAFSKITNKA